jgi:hypothetical protein
MLAVFEYAPVLKGESTMSLDIDQIALHQLIKRDENQLELALRDSLLPATNTVNAMVEELHRVYSAKSKADGLFNAESELVVRATMIFSLLAVPRPVVCAMSLQNTPSLKAAWCCLFTTAIWRWNTC